MKPIPISAAKRIADEYGYDQVIILGRRVDDPNPDENGEHMTTYGRTRMHCSVAGRVGKFLQTKVMGWHKENEA